MTTFGKIDDDCNCPKLSGKTKMSLFLTRGNRFIEFPDKNIVETALVNTLGYTSKQAEIAVKFMESRGECLLFTGTDDEVMKCMEILQGMKIPCAARTEGIIK